MSTAHATRCRPRCDERGLTLVELLVSSMISILLLALIGSLFIRTLLVQDEVQATTTTTNDAKVQFDDLQTSVRLAVETDVRSAAAMTTVPASGRGDVLVVKSRKNEGAVTAVSTWRCVGWYLASDGSLRRKSVAAQSTGTPATATDPSTWPVVATDVSGISGTSPFLLLDPAADVDAWYPGSVTVNLHFEADRSNTPVTLSSTIAPRRQLQLDGEVPGGVKCVL